MFAVLSMNQENCLKKQEKQSLVCNKKKLQIKTREKQSRRKAEPTLSTFTFIMSNHIIGCNKNMCIYYHLCKHRLFVRLSHNTSEYMNHKTLWSAGFLLKMCGEVIIISKLVDLVYDGVIQDIGSVQYMTMPWVESICISSY